MEFEDLGGPRARFELTRNVRGQMSICVTGLFPVLVVTSSVLLGALFLAYDALVLYLACMGGTDWKPRTVRS
jgi:hypothetical protein